MDAEKLLKTAKRFAVIGVSDNPEKYSYRIYQRLLACGYETYGVSFRLDHLDGQKIYKHLKDIPVLVDVAVFVVSPKNGYAYLKECQELGIKHLWMQPGTYDDEMLKALKQSGSSYYLDCILRRTPNITK